jgi:aminocarboxymuconate-semialdehyde decarboxylase
MKVIDIDSHAQPRNSDFVIDPAYSHISPRYYSDGKGTTRYIFNNKVINTWTSGEVALGRKEGKLNWEAGYYDGAVRHKHVTEAGIDFQFIVTGGIGIFGYVDSSAGAAFCRSFNDFLYNTYVKPYPSNFSILPQLPLQDLPEAGKELERCIKNLSGLVLCMPTNWKGIDIADPHWWNFYDRAKELSITGVIVHISSLPAHSTWVGQERLSVLGPAGTTGRRIVSQPFEYCTNIINLIFGGTMDSFPDFKFAFLEAGAEFAIVLKHRIRENLEQIAYLRDMLAHPLDWYFDRFYFLVDDFLLSENGKRLKYAIEELGEDHLFLGSDYPHLDGHLETFGHLKNLNWLASDVKDKILGGNALKLIGRNLPE